MTFFNEVRLSGQGLSDKAQRDKFLQRMRNSLPLGQSEFGLWFSHKGRHYFSGIAEAGHISRLIQEFDDLF
ncbi:hypothetical protein A9502_30785 [Klebsiella pneumoniae]|nr:hypothetical protein A9502_30785 [Klebsiella pneumoniae]